MPTLSEIEQTLENTRIDGENASKLWQDPPGIVTLRNGDSVENLRKRLEDVGYKVPVPFSSGLNPLDGSFTVYYDGNLYAANPASVPFTTTGTFNINQWKLLTDPSTQVLEGSVIESVYLSPEGTTQWDRWTSGTGTYSVDENEVYDRGNTWTFTTSDIEIDGMNIDSTDSDWVGMKNAFSYTVEVDFTLVSGSLSGGGVYISWTNTVPTTFARAIEFSEEHLVAPLVNGQVNRFIGVLPIPATFTGTFASHRVNIFSNWGSFTPAGKVIKFHRVHIRPSTHQEIANGGVTRSAMVKMISQGYTPVEGMVYNLDGVSYVGQLGADIISDLEGLVPHGRGTEKHWNIPSNGTTDATTKVQEAADSGWPMTWGKGYYRITSQINRPNNSDWVAQSPWDFSPMNISSHTDISGAVFVCDFAGVAHTTHTYRPNNALMNTERFSRTEGFVFYNGQEPATRPSGWSPTMTPWAFRCGTSAENARDVRDTGGTFTDNICLGFTHGYYFEKGMERGEIARNKGDCFNIFMQIDACYDKVRVTDNHHWPFGGNTGVVQENQQNYTINNCSAYRFGRVDGLVATNNFTIFVDKGIEFFPSESGDSLAGGATTNAYFVGNYIDGANSALYVGGTYASGWLVDAAFTGGTLFHISSLSGSMTTIKENVLIESPIRQITFTGVDITASGQNRSGSIVKLDANAGYLGFTNCDFSGWDSGATNAPAFVQSGTGSYIDVSGFRPKGAGATGADVNVLGKTIKSGSVTYDTKNLLWTPTISIATPGDSSITYSTQYGSVKVVDGIAHTVIRLVFNITHTTAAGNITINGFPLSIPTSVDSPITAGFVDYGTREMLSARYNTDKTISLALSGGDSVIKLMGIAEIDSGDNIALFINSSVPLI